MGDVGFTVDADGIGLITVTNPTKLNAWTQAMRASLTDCFREAESMPREECRAIVIAGSGDNFSAGQDLDEAFGWDEGYAEVWVRAFRSLYDLPRRCAKPVVGAIKGVCAGSAFQFALCLDYRVSHATARIGQPEIASGQASVTGAGLLLASVGSTVMRSMVLTARLLSGIDAYRVGLVDELVEPDDVLATAMATARRLSDLPAEAYAASKLAICSLEDAQLDKAFDAAVAAHASVYASGAPQRAIAAFKQQRSHAV